MTSPDPHLVQAGPRTGVAPPVRIGPGIELVNPTSVGMRRLADLPEVAGNAAGTYLLDIAGDGTVSLLQSAQLAGTGYRHVQLTADTSWIVTHGLGYNPAGVVIRDSAGDITEQDDIVYVNPNTLMLVFDFAISGTAEFS